MKNLPYATHDMAFDLYVKVASSPRPDYINYFRIRDTYIREHNSYDGRSAKERILSLSINHLQSFYKELKEIYVPI